MRNLRTWLGVGMAAVAAVAVGVLLLADGSSPPGALDEERAEAASAAPGAVLRAADRAEAAVSEAPYRIDGRVTEGGRGVAGVRVVANRTGSAWDASDPTTWNTWSPTKVFRDGLERIDDPKLDPVSFDAEGESDADGAFVLKPSRPGSYTVTPRPAPPWVGSAASASVTASRPTASVALPLHAGTALRGRVLDAHGAPVAAVVDGSWELRDAGGWASVRPVRTDPATGDFLVPAAPAGKGTLGLRLPGRGSVGGFAVTTPYEGVYVIRLGGGGSVRGRVVDAAGAPVAGADVLVSTVAEGARPDGVAGSSQGRATSAADGAYRVDGLVPGPVTAVSALADGFVLEARQPPRAPWSGAAVVEGKEVVIDLVLSRGGAVAGRVVEAGTGKGIPGATVALHRVDASTRNQMSAPLTTTTADDGSFRLDGAAIGKWLLLPTSPGHYLRAAEQGSRAGLGMRPGGGSTPPDLTVVLQREGETAERVVEMLPGLPVRGRVLGPDGAPVAGARVQTRQGVSPPAWRWGINLPSAPDLAVSGEDGAFLVPGLAPRDDWVLLAKKDAMVGEPSEPVRVAAGAPTPDVTLRLTVGATVVGRVLDPQGAPVLGATVSGWSTEGGHSASGQTTTDANGAFTLTGVAAGTLQLSAWAQSRTVQQKVEELQAGERREGVEVRFEKTVALSGLLVDADGKPVAGRSVLAQGPSGGSTNAATGGDGRFTFQVAAGRHRMHVLDAEGRWLSAGHADAPATDVRLVVPVRGTTRITGRITGPGGEPVPLCSVAVGARPVLSGWGGGGDANEVVNGELVREVDGSPPFDLRVSAPRDARGRPLNLRPATARVTDPSTPVLVVLEGGDQVRGSVVGPGDQGIEGASVSAGDVLATTDAAGAFALVGLSPGEVTIGVQPPPGFVVPGSVRARVGSDDVVVRLVAAGAIAGRVLGPDARPLRQGTVQASWQPSGHAWAQVGADGRFRLDQLPPDATVDLTAQSWGEPASMPRPAVLAGVRVGAEDVVLRLEAGVSITGVVVGTDGKASTDVSLSATREGASGAGGPSWAQVNPDGTFAIGGLAPGSYRITARRGNEAVVAEVRAEAPSKNVRIEVAPAARVSGRVEGSGDPSGFLVVPWTASGQGGRVTTGTDGSFSLDLPAGVAVRLTASKADDDRYAVVEDVTPPAAGVALRLEAGASIEGVVEGAEGARPWVAASGDRFQTRARADADGRFRVRGLPPGRYRVETWLGPESEQVAVSDVEAGASGVRLRR